MDLSLVSRRSTPAPTSPPPRARSRSTLLAVLGGIASLFVATAYGADLLEIYRLAELNDPTYRAAAESLRATNARLPQARAVLLPQISGTADATRNDVKTVTDIGILSRPAGQADYNSTGYTLSLRQPIYNAAAYAGLRQARAEGRRAAAEYAAARHDLMLRTAEAYFQVLAARDALSLALAERQATERQWEVAEGRREVGLAAITDVYDARARFEIATAQEIDAQNQLADRLEALRELTGNRTELLAPLGLSMPLIMPDPPDIDRWVQTALSSSYAIAVRREAAETAHEEVRRQRAGHYPTLDVVGNQTREDAEGSITGPGVRSDVTTIGLQLNVPLYQGGLVNARTTEAAHRYAAAQQELERQRRATERATRTAYQGAASGAARVTALDQAVTAAAKALDARRQGFHAGIHSNLDVLNATRDLFRARRDFTGARYEYVINTLRLKQAVGTLSEDDLMQVNSWLVDSE